MCNLPFFLALLLDLTNDQKIGNEQILERFQVWERNFDKFQVFKREKKGFNERFVNSIKIYFSLEITMIDKKKKKIKLM